MNFKGVSAPQPPSFQMAPMIDCVFLMLCFFVTSQVFSQWESEIDITLPTAETGEPPARLPGEIILNVFPNGDVVVNSRKFSDDALTDLLTRVVKMFPGQPVLLRADAKTSYEHVIHVLDICRKCEIWNISFATGVPTEKNAQDAEPAGSAP